MTYDNCHPCNGNKTFKIMISSNNAKSYSRPTVKKRRNHFNSLVLWCLINSCKKEEYGWKEKMDLKWLRPTVSNHTLNAYVQYLFVLGMG